LEYALSVWLDGGEKKKLVRMQGDSTTNNKIIEQLEECQTQFDHLQKFVMHQQ
jgi:Zn-finger nucleic acid-binding protein